MIRTTDARYKYAPCYVKIMALGPDGSTPLPLEGGAGNVRPIFGGIGPFDFSGVGDIADVDFFIKIDTDLDSVVSIDLTAGVSQAAITAAEMVTAITAALYTDVTAEVDSRGYLKISVDTPTTENYLQVYGEGAELSDFGQGYGAEFITLDTQQSFSIDPTLKESEAVAIVDSKNKETEVLLDGYRKGHEGVLTDTAWDTELRAVLEGGIYDLATTFYNAPTSDSLPSYFAWEMVRPVYGYGTNKERDVIGYKIERGYSCVASFGTDPGDKNFAPAIYNIKGTSYKDPVDGLTYSDQTYEDFTRAEFEALDYENI